MKTAQRQLFPYRGHARSPRRRVAHAVSFPPPRRADPHQSPSFDPCSNPALGRCSSQANGEVAQGQKRSHRGCTRRDVDGGPSRAHQRTAGTTRRIVTPEILGQQATSAQHQGVATARSLPDTHLGGCVSLAHPVGGQPSWPAGYPRRRVKTGAKSTMPSGWARAVCRAACRSRSFFAGTAARGSAPISLV